MPRNRGCTATLQPQDTRKPARSPCSSPFDYCRLYVGSEEKIKQRTGHVVDQRPTRFSSNSRHNLQNSMPTYFANYEKISNPKLFIFCVLNSADLLSQNREEAALGSISKPLRNASQAAKRYAEAFRSTAEPLKSTAEAFRRSSEPLKSIAEALRSTAEALRSTAEALRSTAEAFQRSSEPLHSTAEPLKSIAQAFQRSSKRLRSTAKYRK